MLGGGGAQIAEWEWFDEFDIPAEWFEPNPPNIREGLEPRFEISTAGWLGSGLHVPHVRSAKDLPRLVHLLREEHTDAWGCWNDCVPPELQFDILLDASMFAPLKGPEAVHLGHHIAWLEAIIADSFELEALYKDFTDQYELVKKKKAIIRVLVVCPQGNQRSVACAEIIKHIMCRSGFLVVNELNHISACEENWGEHMKTCTRCKHPHLQPGFIEVLNKAVIPEKR